MVVHQQQILFICKYFFDSAVHNQLINNLCTVTSSKSTVFIASDKVDIVKTNTRSIFYNYKFPPLCKYFLLFRSILSFIYIKKITNLNSFSYIFCHSLVVDGLIGFLIYLFTKKPYVLMIRQTDLYFYHKYFFHFRLIYLFIVKQSCCIGFTSFALRDKFLSIYGNKYSTKLKVWPNGVDKIWLDNNSPSNIINSHTSHIKRVIFVGRYNKNKNLLNLYSSVKELNSNEIIVELHFVGGSSAALFKMLRLNILPDWIVNHGILEKGSISNLFDLSDCLCVPSFRESFGLVYIEALSRGIPVIYSKGQAIDKFFDKHTFPVNPKSITSISRAITCAISTPRVFVDISNFNWRSISKNIKIDIKDNVI